MGCSKMKCKGLYNFYSLALKRDFENHSERIHDMLVGFREKNVQIFQCSILKRHKKIVQNQSLTLVQVDENLLNYSFQDSKVVSSKLINSDFRIIL